MSPMVGRLAVALCLTISSYEGAAERLQTLQPISHHPSRPVSNMLTSIPPQFQGTWAPRSSACGVGSDQLDPIEKGAIKINARRIEGYEQASTLKRIVSSTPSRLVFQSSATDETGEPGVRGLVTLTLSGQRLTVRNSGSAEVKTYIKCGG